MRRRAAPGGRPRPARTGPGRAMRTAGTALGRPLLAGILLAGILLAGSMAAGTPALARTVAAGTPALAGQPAAATAAPAGLRPASLTADRPRRGLAAHSVPVLAYYYIWFQPTSWNRAKIDYPMLGRYSSGDATIMRQQVREAKQAGISGFLVSWKDTPVLDQRLAVLRQVAAAARFHLSVVFEGRDFRGKPLPMAQVQASFAYLAAHYAGDPVFGMFGRPLVVWSGTWAYTGQQLASVTSRYGARLTILASDRHRTGYQAIAHLFRGDAYYWSSADPLRTPGYARRLREFSAAVHARGGLWIAPAAPGFDKKLLGGHKMVPRRGGETLRLEMNAAMASLPDAIGLISWNEYSENSEVEPSRDYGNTALRILAAMEHTRPPAVTDFDSSNPSGFHAGPSQFLLLAGLVLLLGGGAAALLRRR